MDAPARISLKLSKSGESPPSLTHMLSYMVELQKAHTSLFLSSTHTILYVHILYNVRVPLYSIYCWWVVYGTLINDMSETQTES